MIKQETEKRIQSRKVHDHKIKDKKKKKRQDRKSDVKRIPNQGKKDKTQLQYRNQVLSMVRVLSVEKIPLP